MSEMIKLFAFVDIGVGNYSVNLGHTSLGPALPMAAAHLGDIICLHSVKIESMHLCLWVILRFLAWYH